MAIQQPAAVIAQYGPGLRGVAWFEFAGNGFDQIFTGDPSQRLAVFIHHKGHLPAG